MRENTKLAGVSGLFIFAVCPLIVKLGLEVASPLEALLGRFIVSCLIFSPLICGAVEMLWRSPLKHSLLFLGSVAGCYYFQTMALDLFPVSWFLIVFAVNPILALLLFRVPMTQKLLGGVFLSLVGTAFFVAAPDMKVSPIEPMAWIYLLLGMLSWVIYTKAIALLQKRMTDLQITANTNIVALFSVVLFIGLDGPGAISASSVLLWQNLVVGVLAPMAFFLFSYTLRRDPVFGIVSQYLEPVMGAGLAILILKEPFNVSNIVGSAAIFLGLVLATAPKKSAD
jgi:drug/metabolite transporter (DMT)-like permease